MPQTSVLTPEGMLSDYPELQAIDDPVWQEAVADMLPMTIPAGTIMYRPGHVCRNFTLLLDGTVRVFVRARNGREIVLYRVGAGETCILTTSCLLAAEAYPAEGVAETAVEALAVPGERFGSALDASPAFRRFVFAGYARRLAELLGLIERVRFEGLDARLARLLLERAGADGRVALTHQAIATELGSAREAVTRRLRDFQAQGLVRTARGAVEVRDREGLRRLADEAR